jgi:hypothetical protein
LLGPRNPEIIHDQAKKCAEGAARKGNFAMDDERKDADQDEIDTVRATKRRKFLKTAAKVAITTPAVTLILSAGTKKTVQAGEYGHF